MQSSSIVERSFGLLTSTFIMCMFVMVFIPGIGFCQNYGNPHPDAPVEIRDWEPMLGTCDCQSVSRNPDGSWQDTVGMEWTFRYIMDGLAVQDISLKEDGKHSMSIRQYIPDSNAWYVTFFNGTRPSPAPATWKGGKVNKSIVLYRPQQAPNGMEGFYKIVFSEIDYTGFNWEGAWVNPDESIVYPTWYIYCKKRNSP